jgi:protein involved in polysaccharide export with SLBB domain
VRTWPLLGFVLGSLLLSGCGGSNYSPAPSTNAVVPSDAIRAGDKITIRLTGVPTDQSYINEYEIPDTGDITVPDMSQPFHAAGMRSGELAERITQAYKDNKIYTNPNVTVISEERYVSVGGDVRTPMRVLYTADLTVIGAINAAGGFDEYADKHHVRIVRGTQVLMLDGARAQRIPGLDLIVYPGDQINVPRTLW